MVISKDSFIIFNIYTCINNLHSHEFSSTLARISKLMGKIDKRTRTRGVYISSLTGYDSLNCYLFCTG